MPRKKSYQWRAGDETGAERQENRPPSRSANKRRSLALQELGEELTRLSPAARRQLELPAELSEALALYADIGDREGRRRQMQYIGRLMRETDAEALRAALAARAQIPAAATARFHQIEQWRDRLLTAPDTELDQLLAALTRIETRGQAQEEAREGERATAKADTIPTPEELRRLALEARREQAGHLAPHASRALFRALSRLCAAR
ncbi:ribosome biogenesis factor YjgA [Desulfovibrio sp. ZJ200]|uniref:ribosome biogenesis factor YjgA n=1 Tax=Desulfovibrio sp. ZJ200 TaxID=2709792 RepID=UPI0013EDC98F|nr:ribosome biogenesis factor YjgA [Desulfovibrio sp. ZJ200]